jgi:hypothetical protein
MIREAGLFGETLGGKVVCIPLWGDRFYGYISFFNKVFDVRVDEPQCDTETTAQVALGERVIIRKFVQDL